MLDISEIRIEATTQGEIVQQIADCLMAKGIEYRTDDLNGILSHYWLVAESDGDGVDWAAWIEDHYDVCVVNILRLRPATYYA